MTTTTVIEQAITIHAAPAAVFDAYVQNIDHWWPRQGKYRYSFAPAATEPGHIRFEPRLGGRYYETFADGREYVIGHITRWEPPQRLTYTWRAPNWQAETIIDVRFTAVEQSTRVVVRHSGWEEAGVPQAAAGYKVGLEEILQHFAAWLLAESQETN